MKLRMFSVVGEALHFGARRMETIIRVAWLPVTLMLVVSMASVFAALSVANNRFISFADLAAGVTFARAAQAAQQALFAGMMSGDWRMWTIWLSTTGLNLILVASFMAPLIRFAGLGERPAPGVVKLAFGPDQIRYILAGVFAFAVMAALTFAPIGATAFFVTGYIVEALSVTYASFPNPESLHTIKLVTEQARLTESGEIWKYTHGAPLIAAAPFALIFWIVLLFHFHPKNRPEGAGPAHFLRRAIVTLLGGTLVVVTVWQGLEALADEKTVAAYRHYLAIMALAIVALAYVNLRVTPYPGVAVCRRSLAPAGALRVTKGWNIVRLAAALLLIVATLIVINAVMHYFLIPLFAATVNTLYQATLSATKLTNSGEAAAWVRPLWAWIWTTVRIALSLLIAFYSYGVIAGLLGRLYRESERGNAPSDFTAR